jgi:hypothetical protein
MTPDMRQAILHEDGERVSSLLATMKASRPSRPAVRQPQAEKSRKTSLACVVAGQEAGGAFFRLALRPGVEMSALRVQKAGKRRFCG